MSGTRLNLAAALVLGLSVGCQASLNADANANANSEGAKARAEADLDTSAEGKGELSRTSATASSGVATSASPNAAPGATAGRVLLGARHDLKLRAGSATASCECLAVALGGSHGAAMTWSGSAPDIDEGTQLSIALSSEGQACKGEPKKSLGASYWGYRLRGNDVVVLVEAGHAGRPLTTGAIIPKPVGDGQVYVAPAKRKLPYGRPLDGKGLCKVGNPGPARNAPFSELEVGENPLEGEPRGQRALSDHSSDDAPTTIEMPN